MENEVEQKRIWILNQIAFVFYVHPRMVHSLYSIVNPISEAMMKRSLLFLLAGVAMSTPCWAMKVTNLDRMPHQLLFESAGTRQVRDIAPGATEYFVSDPDGTLSLLSAEHPKPSRGTVHADGVLSGIIGVERTDQIPTDSDDNYAIWPDGRLSIQQHQHMRRGYP